MSSPEYLFAASLSLYKTRTEYEAAYEALNGDNGALTADQKAALASVELSDYASSSVYESGRKTAMATAAAKWDMASSLYASSKGSIVAGNPDLSQGSLVAWSMILITILVGVSAVASFFHFKKRQG